MTNDAQWMVPDAHLAAAVATPKSPLDEDNGGLSPYEYLLRAFESHISGERDVLGQYRELAESTKDPVVALLMSIVLDDEERHHSLLRRVATRLKDDLNWSQTPGALPTGSTDFDQQAYNLLAKFIASERTGIRELEDLATRVEGLYGGLPTELLEMMTLDSRKHEHILRFLFRRQGEALKQSSH